MLILKKLRNSSVSLKATLAFGTASFAVSGINYITTPIFTRLLSTSDYGVIAVYNSWNSIIQVFATMTLIFPGILQVGLYEHSENRWKYLSSILGIITCATGILAILCLFFYDPVSALLNLSPSLLILILLTSVFSSATTLWTTRQRYEYNYKITILVTIGSAVVAQVVSIAAVLIAQNRLGTDLANIRLWSAGAVNIVVGIFLYLYILLKGKVLFDFPFWKATIIVAFPLIPHYLSSVILQSTDKIMISQMVGDDKAGIYSIAATLSSIGILFWRALNTTFSPFVNYKLGERRFKDINDSILPLLSIVGLGCVMGALAAPEIISVLATSEYLSGVYIIPPIVIGIFLHALYDVFSAVAFFYKKSTRIMTASVVAAVMNIILNYVCIKHFGFIAAGYTTMVSNLILTTMHYFNIRFIETEKIYDIRFILRTAMLVTCGCLSCNFLYQVNGIIRYAVIIFILCLFFKRRKTVINAINNMKV